MSSPHEVSHPPLSPEEQARIGLDDREIVALMMTRGRLGLWRSDLATGHFFATAAIHDIFGLDFTPDPVNMVALTARIHPDDLPLMMETYERASREGVGYDIVYRVRDGIGYKFVRSLGTFRRAPERPVGEIVGITHELTQLRQSVSFSDD